MKNLVIFDLDGTLAQTYYADHKGYLNAVKKIVDIDVNYAYWQDCKDLTDSAIFHHIFNKIEGRGPTAEEIVLTQQNFINILSDYKQENPNYFKEIPGAKKMTEHLKDENYIVGVATGGWKVIADFKLANIEVSSPHVIGSDNHFTKKDFTENLIHQVINSEGEVNEITYIGDSIYDYEASKALDLNFIGIDYNGIGKLEKAGVKNIIKDYTDVETVMNLLKNG